MPSGQQQLVLKRAGFSYPAQMVDEALASVLAASGCDPWALNRVSWPVGMSRHAHGEILVTETTIRAMLSDNAGAVPGSVDLWIGPASAPVVLVGMIPLNPRPIIVAGTGSHLNGASAESRLYALPVVDQRYFANEYSQNSFNVPGPAGCGIFHSTSQNGVSALWSYDQIVAQLALEMGITVTITDPAGTTSYPYGYSVQGMSAAQVMDQILAETGRVLVRTTAGAYSVEFVDRRTVSDVLSPFSGSIISGSASWFVGTPVGWLSETMPVAAWRQNIIPRAVRVSSPFFLGVPFVDSTIEGGRQVVVTNATYTAATAGLNYNASNSPLTVQDSTPGYGTGSSPANATALLARANDLARAYYRRFIAGEMRGVVVRGCVTPVFGGSCLEAVWSVDGVIGSRTVLRAEVDDPILGFLRNNPAALSAGEAFVYGMPQGSGVSVVHPQQRLVTGTITGTTGDDPSLPSGITYSGVVDGEFSQNTFSGLSPAFRPTGPAAKLHPAANGTKCLLLITDSSSGGAVIVSMLVAFGETPYTGACP